MAQRKKASDNNQSDKRLLFVFSIQQNANRQFAVIKDRLIVQPLKINHTNAECGGLTLSSLQRHSATNPTLASCVMLSTISTGEGSHGGRRPKENGNGGTLWPKPPLSSGASIKGKGPSSSDKAARTLRQILPSIRLNRYLSDFKYATMSAMDCPVRPSVAGSYMSERSILPMLWIRERGIV
jgi:hypothetical protein